MKMPPILYGTAWKKEKTAALVVQAVEVGFRGIDTAGQPKHYYEAGVGEALQILSQRGISRDQLFIQTKFSPSGGQDPRAMPYDATAPLAQQVAQSFASSQRNLGTPFVDSLVVHSPLPRWSEMMEVWRAMEDLHSQGAAKALGISNCYDLEILAEIYRSAEVKPSVVQNRFYAETDYDTELRAWCLERQISYQSFWTLTANPHLLNNSAVQQAAKLHQKTPAQVFFRFVTQLGITPLTGTQSEEHMKQDLSIFEFELSKEEMKSLQGLLLH